MTLVNLRGQKLDLISKCCKANIVVENRVSHVYRCKRCKKECAVVVSGKDKWSKEEK